MSIAFSWCQRRQWGHRSSSPAWTRCISMSGIMGGEVDRRGQRGEADRTCGSPRFEILAAAMSSKPR